MSMHIVNIGDVIFKVLEATAINNLVLALGKFRKCCKAKTLNSTTTCALQIRKTQRYSLFS